MSFLSNLLGFVKDNSDEEDEDLEELEDEDEDEDEDASSVLGHLFEGMPLDYGNYDRGGGGDVSGTVGLL